MTTLLAPPTLEGALAALAEAPAEILAGGTDLWPKWSSGQPRPERVLSLHRLRELRAIGWSEGGASLRIGAACSHSDLVRSAEVAGACPSLAEAAATIGALQIQNQGTLGGNLCNGSPAADLPPALAAAGAEVELASARGVRRVALASFYTGYRTLDRRPDELVAAVLVPALPRGARESFRKLGTRRAQAIAKVCGACRLELAADGAIARAGIAFGSVAPTVIRLTELEAWLVGKRPEPGVADRAEALARELVQPIDDLRSSAEYRRHVAGRLVRGWLSGS